MLPQRMMEVHYDGAGGSEVVRLGEAAVPRPGEGQVLIAVAAAGVNRPDLLQRSGNYPPPRGESPVPGLEVSGRVAAAGPNAAGLKEGDEVCALVGSGGYADYALAAAELCLPRPASLTLEEAGGLPETLFTVFDNVVTRGRLAAGERFLVHGGTSGIGTIAIQLARAMGAEVFATAGSPEKCASCRRLGAAHAIDYRAEDFAAAIRAIVGREGGIDVVLDMVGGSYLAKNMSVMATDGRLVQIAFLGGTTAQADFTAMMVRRLTLTGSTLRARTLPQKAAVARALREKAWTLVETGAVKPVIHATFPLAQAREAQEMMEGGAHVGKILLLPGR